MIWLRVAADAAGAASSSTNALAISRRVIRETFTLEVTPLRRGSPTGNTNCAQPTAEAGGPRFVRVGADRFLGSGAEPGAELGFVVHAPEGARKRLCISRRHDETVFLVTD